MTASNRDPSRDELKVNFGWLGGLRTAGRYACRSLLPQLCGRVAGADTLPAAQNVNEGALCLQVSKFGGPKSRVRELRLRNRIGCAHRILNVGRPCAKIGLWTDVRGRIARRIVDRRRYDLDDAVGRDAASQWIVGQVVPNRQGVQIVVALRATAAFRTAADRRRTRKSSRTGCRTSDRDYQS